MSDNSTHYKQSSRPHYGKPNKCEKGIIFPTKKCISCDKYNDCYTNSIMIQYKYKEGREIHREENQRMIEI
jgi:hypothetical protein